MKISEAFTLYTYEEFTLKGKSEKSVINYSTTIKSLVSAISDKPVTSLTYNDVERWNIEMNAKHYASSTIRHNLGKLKKVLKYTESKGYETLDYRLIDIPTDVRMEKPRVTEKEANLLIDIATTDRDKALVAMLYATGCPVSEVLNINREDVGNNKVRIIRKDRSFVEIKLPNWVSDLLMTHLKSMKKRGKALFISERKTRITVSRVEQIIHTLSLEAGLEKHISPNSFRDPEKAKNRIVKAPIYGIPNILYK